MIDKMSNYSRLKVSRYGRGVIVVVIVVLGATAAAALLTLLVLHSPHEPSRSPATAEEPTEHLQPSLNCAFYDFMHARIIAGFDFVVTFPAGEKPRFDERAEGSDTAATTSFEAGHRPTWSYGHDEDGTPTITSPDGATRIVLYGLNLKARGVLRIEAGIRSNDYRNLGGDCQQVNFDDGGDG